MENNHIRLTATVTWITCENFGTYLQAYALQQVITKLGYRNRIISDYRYARATSLRSFLGRWKRRILCLPTEYCNTDAFKQFKRQYLQLDEQWKDFDDLNQRYDLFICGSDQIWTPYVTKINPFFRGKTYNNFSTIKS